jgi:hypothetical protein
MCMNMWAMDIKWIESGVGRRGRRLGMFGWLACAMCLSQAILVGPVTFLG